MKFAIVSTHDIHGARIHINPEHGDGTSFINWVSVLNGFHFNFKKLNEDGFGILKGFDVVMMSGHLNHIVDIINIARFLKDTNVVSMFFPEGSAQLYDNSIRGFHREYYDAWNACDILAAVEEDKIGYYKSLVTKETLVKFIHVPITRDMEAGGFLVQRQRKINSVVVYGDNNPNHPIIAMACARKINAERVIGVEISKQNAEDIETILDGLKILYCGKMSHNQFLRTLGSTLVHFYPTEWIGTAREQISCAAVGTPCIGNHDSHTQRRLFPELGCDIYDVERMNELASRLIVDSTFYNEMVRRAFDKMQFYNLDNSRRRFFEAWEQACDMKRARTSVVTK